MMPTKVDIYYKPLFLQLIIGMHSQQMLNMVKVSKRLGQLWLKKDRVR